LESEESVILHEQLEGVAKSVSIWLVLLGGLGGVAIAAGNIMSLSQAISDGRTGLNLVWPLLALAFGAGLGLYFGYIALLKARLKRDGR
jgi:hypothetical protein